MFAFKELQKVLGPVSCTEVVEEPVRLRHPMGTENVVVMFGEKSLIDIGLTPYLIYKHLKV